MLLEALECVHIPAFIHNRFDYFGGIPIWAKFFLKFLVRTPNTLKHGHGHEEVQIPLFLNNYMIKYVKPCSLIDCV